MLERKEGGANVTEFKIVQAEATHLPQVLELYSHLGDNPLPVITSEIRELWAEVLANPQQTVLLGFLDGRAVSTCVVVIVKNMTHGQRPYAIVENVVTHPDYRGSGYATAVLDAARNLAQENHCYKITLTSGTKQDSTMNFYRRAGYNSADKTAFVQWL